MAIVLLNTAYRAKRECSNTHKHVKKSSFKKQMYRFNYCVQFGPTTFSLHCIKNELIKVLYSSEGLSALTKITKTE